VPSPPSPPPQFHHPAGGVLTDAADYPLAFPTELFQAVANVASSPGITVFDITMARWRHLIYPQEKGDAYQLLIAPNKPRKLCGDIRAFVEWSALPDDQLLPGMEASPGRLFTHPDRPFLPREHHGHEMVDGWRLRRLLRQMFGPHGRKW